MKILGFFNRKRGELNSLYSVYHQVLPLFGPLALFSVDRGKEMLIQKFHSDNGQNSPYGVSGVDRASSSDALGSGFNPAPSENTTS